MFKPRIRAVERRLARHRRPEPQALRVVEVRDGEPEPHAAPGECLLILRIVDPRAEDADEAAIRATADSKAVGKRPRSKAEKGGHNA